MALYNIPNIDCDKPGQKGLLQSPCPSMFISKQHLNVISTKVFLSQMKPIFVSANVTSPSQRVSIRHQSCHPESRESYQGRSTGTIAWITSITTSHVSTECDYFSLETNPDSLFGRETNKNSTTTRSHALRSINIAWSLRRVFQRNYRRCQTMTSLLS